VGVARIWIVLPLQSPETGSSCFRRVATAAASSPAVRALSRVLPESVVSPYWLTIPPWPLPLPGSAFEVFPRAPAGSNGWIRAGSSRGLRSASEYDPSRTALPRSRVALNNVLSRPGTLSWGFFPYSASGGGQRPTPGLPARLCCVFGLSQPLDALFRPRPCRSCFVPAALLGFPLQRFLPPRRRDPSRHPLPLLALLSTAARGGRPSPVRVRVAVAVGLAPKSGTGPSREDAVGIGRASRGS
jgi:hypothetical protein